MGDVEALAPKLAALATEFEEQVGKRPSLGELLELLGWASHGVYPVPLAFNVKLKGGKRYSSLGRSLVGELNDSIFVDAASFLSAMAKGASGRLLPTSELASSLVLTLKDSRISLEDVAREEVAELTVHTAKKPTKPRIGDVLAIPASGGGYRIASVVARNRFGTALGFIRGRFDVPRPASGERLVVHQFPIYTDDRLVATGAWRVVGHDENLLSLFPAEPEIYHAPDLQWPGIDLGKFGAAEKAAGEIRLIEIDEARAVGLLDGTYRQSYLGELLEQFMESSLDY
ncbi:hypothetical protein O7599_24390 [Streptomyces sp. WMMC500]|uniref:hypothetical protein n=1 Tax=Streptomyces sp. WMMC500 TaxID=3015154 RepID=UPI00248C5B8C|nr:hypothetical protein [Streptomyces sp. WMMC500]WBB58741.1 hypothetical protein O7599_24390 [Streptomyces sp. WMMC500]